MAKSRIHDEPHHRRGPTGRPVTASRPRVPGASAPRSFPAGLTWRPGITASSHRIFVLISISHGPRLVISHVVFSSSTGKHATDVKPF